ncbi:DMT family transporter [Chelatococcus sp. GCM10030263]|uniref:DMT family transporter n=1 Tax=Chelatococcus sp. GCM10030263 TaxID=3273387 RepID=UPI0036159C9E
MSPSDPPVSPTVSVPARNAPLVGIGLMVLGIFAYSVNDVMGKWLVSTYSVPQILLIRSIFALAILAPFIWREGRTAFMTMPRPGLQLLRGAAVVFEVTCFYWSVAYLPLADVMTYYLAGPIYVTALSPFLLGERVGWRRWTAVIVGFVGVLIALRPSAGTLSLPAVAAFAGSLSFALLMIITRKLRGTSETVLITMQVVAPLIFGLIVAPLGWLQPSRLDFVLLGLLGVVSMSAGFCVNRALKLAPASVVVPYQYTMIVWAVIFGYVFFADIPRPETLIGAAIIVAAGLFIFLREQAAARQRPAE